MSKKRNPTIEELQAGESFELAAEVDHREIKNFVIRQMTTDQKIIRFYMVYQLVMVLVGLFFSARAIVLAIRGAWSPLFYSILALVFSFTLLIAVHELLHGIALKLAGAPKISFGGSLKKFIFYAEADRHVLNRSQFTLVALAPLVVVQVVTLAGILAMPGQPVTYGWIFIMSAHSLFCAGDIGLLSFFCADPGSEVFTFDVKKVKKSYFYKRVVHQ